MTPTSATNSIEVLLARVERRRQEAMTLNLKATLKTALAFITDQGLKDSYRDFCGGWPMPTEAKIDAAEERRVIDAVLDLANKGLQTGETREALADIKYLLQPEQSNGSAFADSLGGGWDGR